MVSFKRGRATVVTDRMSYEYQEGLAVGDDPTQASLDEALTKADRVRVIAGGMYRDFAIGMEILAEESDPEIVAELVKALRVVDDPSTFNHCMCLGHPAIEFYSGTEMIGTLAIHHGKSIRWPLWKHDAILVDNGGLLAWMASHGIEADRLLGVGDYGNLLELLALTPAQRCAGRGDSYRQRGDRERAFGGVLKSPAQRSGIRSGNRDQIGRHA